MLSGAALSTERTMFCQMVSLRKGMKGAANRARVSSTSWLLRLSALQDQMLREHFGKLSQQAEVMRQSYPNFDLQKELENKDFLRLTSPDVGLSVEDAFFAVHHKELAPQMMAYGMQRAKQQMGQTLQAQRNRPAEGAMRSQGQPAATVRIDPRNMTRREREEIKRQVRLGKRVSFD